MDKRIRLAAWIALSAAVLCLGWQNLRPIYATPSGAPEALPGSTVLPTASAPSFAVGVAREIDFRMDEGTRDRLDERERADQLRDWLLFTVVSDAGLSAEETNRALFDLPTVRHGHMRPVANFEYGLTRSCYLGDRRVVAVIPRCEGGQRRDYLAHVADESRKTLGQKPDTLVVFEYDLDMKASRATITRHADVPGVALFTEEYGYVERDVRSLDDFTALMRQIQDVTFARKSPSGGLLIGGRSLQARSYRGLRVEDVAAVWQAQTDLLRRQADFEQTTHREHEALKAKWQARLDDLNRQSPWGSGMSRTPRGVNGSGLSPLERLNAMEQELRAMTNPLRQDSDLFRGRDMAPRTNTPEGIQAAYHLEGEALNRRLAEQLQNLHLTDHTGFSLDPTCDYKGAAKWFDEKASTIAPQILKADPFGTTRSHIEQARKGFHEGKEVPFLELIDHLKKGTVIDQLLAELLNRDFEAFRFQAARYDGDLQGTEVGMILFYTDLLAKLWQSVGFDMPRQDVPGFRSMIDGGIPAVYEQQTREQPATRIWFGPEDRHFTIGADGTALRFARTATRIFAASSNPLRPDQEVPPTYSSEHTMGWWNQHYEEVARYEQEYERLNEYIKWSILIGWLGTDDSLPQLGFLKNIKVDHSAWFKDWAAKHPELRYKNWARVGFYDRGYKGTKTEAMPIMRSEAFADYGSSEKQWYVSGGVSGARIKDLQARPKLPSLEGVRETAKFSFRGLDPTSLEAGASNLRTLRGTLHEFEAASSPLASVMKVTADGKVPLQGTYGDVALTSFNRKVQRQGSRVTFETSADATKLGELSIQPRGNGFVVANSSRNLDAGLAVGRDLSRQGKAILAKDPRVAASVEHAGGVLDVQLVGSEKWLRFSPESKPSATVAKGWQGRVADSATGAKTYLVAQVEPAEVALRMQKGEALRLPLTNLEDARPLIDASARGPPADAVRITLAAGGDSCPAYIRPDGTDLVILPRDLPPAWKSSPEQFTRRFGPAERKSLAAFARSAKANDTWAAPSGPPKPPKPPEIVQLAGEGNFRDAAARLARDPAESKRAFDAWRRERLREAADLLRADRPNEALALIVGVEGRFGCSSESRALAGLAELRRGRPKVAAELLSRPLTPEARQVFLDNAAKFARSPGVDPITRTNIATAKRFVRDIDVTPAGGSTVRLKVEDGRLHVHAEIRTSDLRPVRPETLAADGQLYIADSVRLGNVESADPLLRTRVLHEAIQADAAELFELHEPGQLATADRLTVTRPTDSPNSSPFSSTAKRFHPGPSPSQVGGAPGIASTSDDDDKEKPGPDGQPVRHRKSRSRPVYVLLPKAPR